ncbi:MAG: PLP-dependent aminotransferase family protein [Myxococcota bacterium]
MRWELRLEIKHDSDTPLYRQISLAIAESARRGRIRPGAPLPSTRRLAAQLGVHRNTVITAYEELRAEGWISSEVARGTYVSSELPENLARSFARRPLRAPDRVGFDLARAALPPDPRYRAPGLLLLYGGIPELRMLPSQELARALRRTLVPEPGLADYKDPQGDSRLRAALAELLRTTRGVPAEASTLLVTQGAQQGLYLIARALLRPGDVVAVEALGYSNGWQALRLGGAELVPIPMDAHGMDIEALEAVCARRRVRAVLLTPHHQYPTTVTLAAGRREKLLGLARRERMMVIEDDYDHEFHFEGSPVLPLAASDTSGVVVYLGTLAKVLAPGLRLGYLVAPSPIIERLSNYRVYVDGQGCHPIERALAELLEDGTVQRHVARVRRAYRARRDVLAEELESRLPELVFTVPTGGMALWARAEGVDVDAWVSRGLDAGVAFQPGRRYTLDGRSIPFVRLGFAPCNEAEIVEAVRRMVVARRTTPRGTAR